jgi:hypothetical protein
VHQAKIEEVCGSLMQMFFQRFAGLSEDRETILKRYKKIDRLCRCSVCKPYLNLVVSVLHFVAVVVSIQVIGQHLVEACFCSSGIDRWLLLMVADLED